MTFHNGGHGSCDPNKAMSHGSLTSDPRSDGHLIGSPQQQGSLWSVRITLNCNSGCYILFCQLCALQTMMKQQQYWEIGLQHNYLHINRGIRNTSTKIHTFPKSMWCNSPIAEICRPYSAALSVVLSRFFPNEIWIETNKSPKYDPNIFSNFQTKYPGHYTQVHKVLYNNTKAHLILM